MSVEGVDETKDALQRVIDRIMGSIPGALEASAILVQADAKILSPWETGDLRRSIGHETHGDYSIVGTNVEYAAFQEFGTSKMSAQPFLTPALNQNRSRIIQIMKSAVKKGAEK